MLNQVLNDYRYYIIVVYDISYDKIRKKIIIELEKYWYRVQKSVFEIFIYENQLKKIEKKFKYFLKEADKFYILNNIENNDSIRFYIISKNWNNSIDNNLINLWNNITKINFLDFIIK